MPTPCAVSALQGPRAQRASTAQGVVGCAYGLPNSASRVSHLPASAGLAVMYRGAPPVASAPASFAGRACATVPAEPSGPTPSHGQELRLTVE
eukprot:10881292-Alexandrium_andersonii.AAC.1